ncbi:MAG: GNAT family N-acetyltransferase [Acidimicrobiia bacterium]
MARSDDLMVRVAGAEDAEALFEVQKSSALAAYEHIFPPDRYPFPDAEERVRWSHFLTSVDLRVFIAERTEPLGVAVSGKGQLQRLFVVSDAWGTGVGSRLHGVVVDALRAGRNEVARLWVLEENARARNFYEWKGWTLDGRTTQSAFPPYPSVLGYSLTLL